MHPLDKGYTAEVDTVDEAEWHQLLTEFTDANIYQTWPYAEVTCGRRNVSHLVLRRDGQVAAIAQARIAKLPLLNIGIAYVHWGPVWRTDSRELPEDSFRQVIRALRNEFACRRGLVVRLFPLLFDVNPQRFSVILEEEGFSSSPVQALGRTILMDLSPSLGDLRDGMLPNWKRNLKVVERRGMEVLEGTQLELFDLFIEIYKDMVSRKNFVEPNDIFQFRRIQTQLPDELKMTIMLCRSGTDVCSGLICSAIGDTAVYLFGATSSVGMKSKGSYLLQWKLLERLKANRTLAYNLNGINPTKNPGTYSFKNELAGKNGRDVQFLGRFDSPGSFVSSTSVEFGDDLRAMYRTLRKFMKTARHTELRPKAVE